MPDFSKLVDKGLGVSLYAAMGQAFFTLSIGVGSMAEGQRVFDALAAGGQVTMPFAATFWSPGFGMVTDRFGTPWMVNVAP